MVSVVRDFLNKTNKYLNEPTPTTRKWVLALMIAMAIPGLGIIIMFITSIYVIDNIRRRK